MKSYFYISFFLLLVGFMLDSVLLKILVKKMSFLSVRGWLFYCGTAVKSLVQVLYRFKKFVAWEPRQCFIKKNI